MTKAFCEPGYNYVYYMGFRLNLAQAVAGQFSDFFLEYPSVNGARVVWLLCLAYVSFWKSKTQNF